jgi:meromycolic acid enoyl-[acyl-carrier protein] reductase
VAAQAGIAAPAPRAADEAAPLLAGRRILVTGVLTEQSLAYAAAAMMQRLGAEVVLTGHRRARRLTERAARTLPRPTTVLELDVTEDEDFPALATALGERWDRVDGILHSIAFAPPELWDDPFLEVAPETVDTAMLASVYSLQRLTAALLPLLSASDGGASIAAMTVVSDRIVPYYGWMGVVKGALETLVRHLAVRLGPQGVRVNAIACGPVRTTAARAIPGIEVLQELYETRAPLGWDSRDHAAAAGPACFLMSDLARSITGDVLNVVGGVQVAL